MSPPRRLLLSVLIAIGIAGVPSASFAFSGHKRAASIAVHGHRRCGSRVKHSCGRARGEAPARPGVRDVVAKAVKADRATLHARVTTHGLATSYRFVYWSPVARAG